MAARQEDRQTWRVALVLSLALHAAILGGLHFIPQRPELPEGPPATVALDGQNASDESGGEVSFIAYTPPESRSAPNLRNASVTLWPAEATRKAGDANSASLGPQRNSSSQVGTPSQIGPPQTGNPAGAQGTTTFFRIPTQGQRIVYVLDASMSMGKNGALKTACQELLASVKQLPPSARFQVIVYNTQPRFLKPRWEKLLEPTPDVLGQLAEAAAALRAEGGTCHGPALELALSLRPDVVFLLTDADDLTQDHLRLARRVNQGKAVIHTIELGDHPISKRDMPLQLLASEHHGQYRAVELRNP